MGISICRLILRVALLLLLLSVATVGLMDRASPGFVPAILSVILNAVTAGAAVLYIWLQRGRK